MNAAEVTQLQASFDAIASHTHEITERFYAVLLAENPGLRTRLPVNLASQKRRFAEAVIRFVACLPRCGFDTSGGALANAGAEHVSLHALVRETLLEVFAEISGHRWNAELCRAWRRAFNTIPLDAMVTGDERGAAAPVFPPLHPVAPS